MKKRKNVHKKSIQPVREPEIPAGITLSPGNELVFYSALFSKVFLFLKKRYAKRVTKELEMTGLRAYQEDMDEPGETLDFNVYYYAFCDYLIHTPGVLEPGLTGIEIYLRNTKNLSLSEMEMLRMMNDSMVTLFEGHVSRSRNEVIMKELLLGTGITLKKSIKPGKERKMLIGGRCLTFSWGPEIGVGFFPFPCEMKRNILKAVQETFTIYVNEAPGSTMRDYIKNINPLFILYQELKEMAEIPEDEIFEEDESEDIEVEFFMSVFEIDDKKIVMESLKKIPNLQEYSSEAFEWYIDGDDEKSGPHGMVVVSPDGLIFAAVSEKMREAGKLMLRSACGQSIRFVKDYMNIGSLDGEQWVEQ
jgi:hypothetical protein